MTKEWWRVQLIYNNILKHNNFATSPASARVNKSPNLSIIILVYFLNKFSCLFVILIETNINGN